VKQGGTAKVGRCALFALAGAEGVFLCSPSRFFANRPGTSDKHEAPASAPRHPLSLRVGEHRRAEEHRRVGERLEKTYL
jgi:hypothetical protein